SSLRIPTQVTMTQAMTRMTTTMIRFKSRSLLLWLPPRSTTTDTHLADALTALGHSLKHLHPSSVKIRMPDTFDGASPQKLCKFLVSCNLVFHNCPDAFEDDSCRICFIIYLKGAALDWF
ncbi:hypothetical protein AX17_006444, partial [Amanita inopinata Kibby_2008]